MKTLKQMILGVGLMSLLACGNPAMVDRGANGSENDDTLPNGQASVTLASTTDEMSFSNIRTNLNYSEDLDALEITVFGTDDSGDYSATLYLVVYDLSTLPEGTVASVSNGLLSGSATYSTVETASSATFYAIDSGELELVTICTDSTSCENQGSYTFTYTHDDVTMTVTGDYDSSSLYLD